MIKSASICTSIITLSLASSLSFADVTPAKYDNPATAEEATGFFSGAIVGGLAGGPPGAILGAAIGAFAGDGFNARKQVGDLQAEVFTARLEADRLRDEARQAQQQYEVAIAELDRLRQAPARTMPAYMPGSSATPCCGNTVMSIHFRTGSSAIEPQYHEQLDSLIKLAKQMPTAAVEITGYADRNGDAQKNLQLSRARSNTVKDYFNNHGVENSSITTVAYGETRPLHDAQTLETDFFDRRVIVKLRDTRESMLSQSQDSE